MSRPASSLYPYHVAGHPQLEPEVKRAILASWASDRVAVPNHRTLRQPEGYDDAVPLKVISEALKLIASQARSATPPKAEQGTCP